MADGAPDLKRQGDVATSAGSAERPAPSDNSLGAERGVGVDRAWIDAVTDDPAVVDLEARYTIEGPLGEGDMGAVLLAADPRLGRKVAIRRIRGAAGDTNAVARFLTDSKAIATLNHPNIVQIHDYGRDAAGPFLIMEYVDGGSLAERCRDGAIPLDEAIDLACRVCDGLAKAHDLGIIHRDIKPANILLTKDGIPKLTDFGLAKAGAASHGPAIAGAMTGASDFMPPEQRRSAAEVDQRSDLWSLAATVYRMVTGRSPRLFRCDDLPPALQGVLGRALDDRKESRYQSARELGDALRAGLRQAAQGGPAGGVGEPAAPGSIMPDEPPHSVGEGFTSDGSAKRPGDSGMSFGDERTVGGNDAAGPDTRMGGGDIADLAARYTIEATLGRGGMGEVLLATDTKLERRVAIKRILGEAARSRTAVLRFLTEAKAIAALNHPNIVQIYDYGRDAAGPFLIMEYVDGGSLLDRCQQRPIPLGEAVDLACRICDGLAKAHDRQIIHRDIKPANILLTSDGIPKLTDFGLAKSQAVNHGLSMAGAVMGTPDFMPPEQRRDASEVDHRSDLWSLAATVYQMVTGRSPRTIRFDLVPDQITKVLARALEDEKDARFGSAREFRDALSGALSGRGEWGAGAGVQAAREVLREGQCKACGTVTSDLTKKFCRNAQCGAALRVPCLKCDAPIPVWDGVCGECGGNQPALLASRRDALATKRSEAESLLASLQFDAALRLAGELAVESHGELADVAGWAAAFATSVAAERDRQRAAAADRVRDARKLVASFDYSGAMHALESIPGVLRDTAATDLLAECRARSAESDRLLGEIAGRIKRKEIKGLLPLVERAAELRGDRKDLAKVRQQLVERRDGLVAKARGAFEAGDVQAAAETLDGIAARERGGCEALCQTIQRALDLERSLVAAVKEAKADGVIDADEARGIVGRGEEYLAINPANGRIALLVAQARQILDNHAQRQREEQERQRQRERLEAERLRRTQEEQTRRAEQRAAEIRASPPLRNSVGMDFRLIPAGSFTMGQAGGEPDETPHDVTLTKPFYLGTYPVTNDQWKRVMGSVPSKWKDGNRPVECVTWEMAVEFCEKLSEMREERVAGRVYRLPTEAEWEYACRGGTTTSFPFSTDLGDFAWYAANAGNRTHPVGEKKPNPWGLYDMHGNVWEWCSDFYAEYKGPATDPRGDLFWGSSRVRRGGCWQSGERFCRSAARRQYAPATNEGGTLGFRVALSLPAARTPQRGGR